MKKFNINIEDGSEVLPQFIVEQNQSSLQLYDWQHRAIEFFLDPRNNYKAIYEVPTGSGKTFCAIQLIKEVWKFDPNCRVLIVVPKNVILERGWIPELYNNGISLLDVGVYYGVIKEYGKVTITNMQNMHNIDFEAFQMVIWDEVHNYCTPRMLYFVGQEFKYNIGLSATIERIDQEHYKLYKIFNYNIFNYTPEEALNDNVLNPFNFTNIGVILDDNTMKKYEELTQHINMVLIAGGGFKKIMREGGGIKFKMLGLMTKRKQLVNNYYKKFDVVRAICTRHRDDKVIVFNQYNAQTTKLYWELLDLNIKVGIVHSDIPKEKRDENLTKFKKDEINILLTTKVLDEGYNLPSIDVGIIMAGDSTAKQTIQRMGRVLRKKNKESNLYQIYCCNTIEQDQGETRAKMFKALATRYDNFIYERDELNL